MADRDDPALLEYLAEENAHAGTLTDHLKPLADTIYEEFRSRINETDLSVPVRHDRWWYYSRTVEGEQYSIEGRVRLAEHPGRPGLEGDASPTGEELLLDQNAEAEGHDFFAVGGSEVSPAGDLLAYGVDLNGDERYDIAGPPHRHGRGARRGRQADRGRARLVARRQSPLLHPGRRRVAPAPGLAPRGRHAGGRRRARPRRARRAVLRRASAPRATTGTSSSGSGRRRPGVPHARRRRPAREPRASSPRAGQGVEYDIEPIGDQLLVVHNSRRTNFELAIAPITCTSPRGVDPARRDHRRRVRHGRGGVRRLHRHLAASRGGHWRAHRPARPGERDTGWGRPTTSRSASRSTRSTSAPTRSPRRRRCSWCRSRS